MHKFAVSVFFVRKYFRNKYNSAVKKQSDYFVRMKESHLTRKAKEIQTDDGSIGVMLGNRDGAIWCEVV